ncbi:hypothetical protein [Muricoccus nepalensis]|uniref:hypothetical protein n=1 Tax=Muricoccus nepalensis TaxID=1854500 RepID=UPI0013871506|nr:hypothetical protein [Roseomonas nepalensis]
MTGKTPSELRAEVRTLLAWADEVRAVAKEKTRQAELIQWFARLLTEQAEKAEQEKLR